MNRYSSTIAAMFFGHTHRDHFQITYSNYANRTAGNALLVSYIAPSLTPTSGMPAFRVYDVDPVTFAVLDSTTYTANMNDPAFQTTGPVWKKYYSAKESYGPLTNPPVTSPGAELSPAFWHDVTAAFETNNAAFQGYIARKSRGWNVQPCDGSCKTQEICQLRAARSQDNCFVPKPGLHFYKRMESPEMYHDECGISVARATLGSLAVRRDVLEHLERRFLAGAPIVMDRLA
jgi:sphingomyelin phosphodiesterase